MGTEVKWFFPQAKFFLMTVEKATTLLITFMVFIFSYLQWGNLWSAFLFAAIFLGIYLVVAYFIQLIRKVEDHYHLKNGRLLILRKTRFSQKKEEVPLQTVIRHRLDRLFLGGYLLTRKQKHLLFFNTKKELEKFDKEIKKYFSV